ncbi:GNAT family N-acetyltransferase [Pseudomonas sp. ABC1]|uniref:GNAT family N-acetyltransferase n=1 Tax=Pseudomonas sp. ABC1 TaxID=2748080 RepID=UPI0015C3C749|nr:GNAT family N-acetyltransferase [Pseudomonas sp. ABC1]QLF95011.1 GNAT family N-acetyltransferase [Pseudomonas sp. ABC1]
MHAQDIPAVMLIQQACYSAEVLESEAVMQSRQASVSDTCWVAEDMQGVCAYLFSYRSRLGKVTPLDGELCHAEDADCLYLHDLAVLPRMAGQGVGPSLVSHALKLARPRLGHSALVSVQDSQGFWSRQGYRPHGPLPVQQQANLDSYGIPAVYMVQVLD